jgi:type IV secretion system protein VirB9
MKMILLLCVTVLLSFYSCAAVDVDQNLRNAGSGRLENTGDLPFEIYVEPEVITVERPVFVPEKEAPRPSLTGIPAVQDANRKGIIRPSDYSHAAIVYDFDPDWVYEVYTQPLRASDIILEPGEQVLEAPFISDSVRWMLGAGVSYEQGNAIQHIYVKPSESSIEASLIINTNRRVYHLILRSYQSIFMPIIRWRYPAASMPNNYIASPQSKDNITEPNTRPSADPRFLSFNYRITYGWFRKPRWIPELVFDDGSKTYITFPESVLNRQLPAVFENRKDVVNYRVIDNLIIIDKLIEHITIKIERTEISIKKRTANGK